MEAVVVESPVVGSIRQAMDTKLVVIDTRSRMIVCELQAVKQSWKRKKVRIEQPDNLIGVIVSHSNRGIPHYRLVFNFSELSNEEALALAKELLEPPEIKVIDRSSEPQQFFEIQSRIDRLSFWLTVMETFLSVAQLGKDDVYWDEVIRFYQMIEEKAKAIREKAEKIAKGEVDG